jgi:hypothetical protein
MITRLCLFSIRNPQAHEQPGQRNSAAVDVMVGPLTGIVTLCHWDLAPSGFGSLLYYFLCFYPCSCSTLNIQPKNDVVMACTGIRRVALLDFDVHHGNGTEECVFNTVPTETTRHIDTVFSDGVERFQHWRPWFDGDDRRNILFASVQVRSSRYEGHRPRHCNVTKGPSLLALVNGQVALK